MQSESSLKEGVDLFRKDGRSYAHIRNFLMHKTSQEQHQWFKEVADVLVENGTFQVDANRKTLEDLCSAVVERITEFRKAYQQESIEKSFLPGKLAVTVYTIGEAGYCLGLGPKGLGQAMVDQLELFAAEVGVGFLEKKVDYKIWKYEQLLFSLKMETYNREKGSGAKAAEEQRVSALPTFTPPYSKKTIH